MKAVIAKLVKNENLTEEEMEHAMETLMTGKATPAQIGAFITAMRIKGETVEEITAAARVIRAHATPVNARNHCRSVNIDRDEINVEEETILDTCGTGGDGTHTFNVSTATAFVVAGAGVKVAKHGNRAVSSRCGSADVLAGLGVNLDVNTSDVETCINMVGIGFLYAPLFHGAMRLVAAPRQEIGLRSLFNLLGPLCNPAGANAQVLGVYDMTLTEKMASVLHRLGTRAGFVVCGEGTFDEISICGPTKISRLEEGHVTTSFMVPEDVGMVTAPIETIRGGDAAENAAIILAILNGENSPRRDMVLLNAGAAFMAAGLDRDFQGGIDRARESIDSGRALQKLQNLIAFTRQCTAFCRK
ncbi:MAG: anthranilate phosphoribosyltransferase [Deltaproteobacteria bacterium]|nr:anthranilate phosphoribosyltransferase [Deltaproteobacteria bacterium]